ncbi:MAG TPA: hypothetical protein VIY29_00685, partial [Ktedonobacteraceae bacterium]
MEDDGHVFIAEFYTQGLDNLKKQFHNEKQHIEKWVNAWSLRNFFFRYQQYHVGECIPTSTLDDDTLIEAFGEVLRFFWSLRLKT